MLYSSIPRAIDSSCYLSFLFLWWGWPQQKSLCVSLSKCFLLVCSDMWPLLACLSHITFILFFQPLFYFFHLPSGLCFLLTHSLSITYTSFTSSIYPFSLTMSVILFVPYCLNLLKSTLILSKPLSFSGLLILHTFSSHQRLYFLFSHSWYTTLNLTKHFLTAVKPLFTIDFTYIHTYIKTPQFKFYFWLFVGL